MGSLRVGHGWAASLSLFTFMHWRRKWQPTPVFLSENPRDGGAWWAAVYGVAQSRTRLKCLAAAAAANWVNPLYADSFLVAQDQKWTAARTLCPLRTVQWPRQATAPLWSLPGPLLAESLRKLTTAAGYCCWHPLPHSHVLPQPALPGRPLLHYHHSPQNARGTVDQQRIDLLWVSGPIFLHFLLMDSLFLTATAISH